MTQSAQHNNEIESRATRDVVERFYKAFIEDDMDAVYALVAEDFVISYPKSLPMAGSHHGHKGLQDVVNLVYQVWKSHTPHIERIIAQGNWAVGMAIAKGQIGDVTDVTMPLCEVYRVENGKIKEAKIFFWDTKFVCDCLGT